MGRPRDCEVFALGVVRGGYYVDVGGAQVGYQVVGEGPVDLVVACGLGSNIDLNWDLPPTAACR
jgi:hypothetical protein